MSTIRCSTCGLDLDEENFHKNKNARFGVSSKCKKCTHEYDLVAYQKNREKILANKKKYGKENAKKIRFKRLESKVNITKEEFDYMLFLQNGTCAICGGPSGAKDFAVDHDHKTGEIRGLLCGTCNTALGSFRDDPKILLSALSYLGWEG